jgi:hypothetical protein
LNENDRHYEAGEDLPKDIEVKASFRYVDDLKNPVHGICGRWECREKMRLEAVAEINSEPQGEPVSYVFGESVSEDGKTEKGC